MLEKQLKKKTAQQHIVSPVSSFMINVCYDVVSTDSDVADARVFFLNIIAFLHVSSMF